MPTKKKKYNSRFPPARIKKIMQSDDEVGKVAAVVPIIISRVLEIFVENLLKESCKITRQRNARTLTPAHIKASIHQNSQLIFLKDIVSLVPDIHQSGDDEQNDYNHSVNYPKHYSVVSSQQQTQKKVSEHIQGLHQITDCETSFSKNDIQISLIDKKSKENQLDLSKTSSNSLNNKRFKVTYSRNNSSNIASEEENKDKESMICSESGDNEEDDDGEDDENNDEKVTETGNEKVKSNFKHTNNISRLDIEKRILTCSLGSISDCSLDNSEKQKTNKLCLEDDDYDA